MSEKTKMLLWKYGALFVMLLLINFGKGAISGIQNRSKAAERLEYAMKEKTHTDKEGLE